MYKVIVTGTDPSSRKGGIGFSLPGYLAAMEHAGIAYISIPTYHPSVSGGKWLLWMRAFPVLRRLIWEYRRTNNKVIVYSHAGAGISLFREGFILAFCRLLGAKTIMQLHAFTVDTYLRHAWPRWLFRMAICPSSAIAVLTPWWYKRLLSSEIKKTIFVIPNPLSAEWEKSARTVRNRRKARKSLVVLTITRIVPGKGVDLLIQAMPLLPKTVQLLVAGDGSQLEIIKERVKSLGLKTRVRFAGWVSEDEKQRLIDEADIFCLPSSYDSFGMGFLEAMANGLPVVALDWGPISDVVSNGRAGILIRDKDPRQLSDAIVRMMDSDFRQWMGDAAKQWVLEQFSAGEVGKLLQVMFENVAG